MILNGNWSSYKSTRYSYQTLINFVERFSINVQIPNLNKIRPVGIELFHADRQTDVTKANSPFSKFCERSHKKSVLLLLM